MMPAPLAPLAPLAPPVRSRSLRAWSSNLFASGPADNWLALEVPDKFLLIAMGCNGDIKQHQY